MKDLILAYYKELDKSIEILSNNKEGDLAFLPPWVLNNRLIRIGYVENSNMVLISTTPSKELNEDVVIERIIRTNEEFAKFNAPWNRENVNIKYLPTHSYFYQFGNVKVIETNNINAVPAFHDPSIRTEITRDLIPKVFSIENAKKDAFDIWNNEKNKLPIGNSFVENLQNIFDRFSSIIKRKSFLERRIHRYLNEYSQYLLPSHEKKYFELPLELNGDKRIADFVLKREDTFPALLIELESPNVKIFKKNGEPTAQANHAKNQIAEWVRFIEQNPKNTEGEFSFLNGPKSRLVIMGRGLDYKEQMENSKYTDTIMWTYDFLIKESKKKCNNFIKAQCEMLGIKNPNLIK